MDFIITKLPEYLDPVCIVIKKLGYRVFYLELSGLRGDNLDAENCRIEKLNTAGIVPLPFEDLTHFTGYSETNRDPENVVIQRAWQIMPEKMLEGIGQLFPGIQKIEKKLWIAVHSAVAIKVMKSVGKVNLWAHTNPKTNYLLIDISPDGFLIPDLAPNVRLVVIPIELVTKNVDTAIQAILHFIQKKDLTGKNNKGSTDLKKMTFKNRSHVAFVPHQGLSYGNLFQKDLFYSSRTDSELHPERLLYIDYSGWPNPSEKLHWVCMGNHRQSLLLNIRRALATVSKGILHIRRFRHILGLLILARFYVVFQSFSTKLDAYPDIRLAFIDYEILCPKELLLSFESKGIQTVAVQERFSFAFNNLFVSIVATHYLCDSPFAARHIKESPLNCIDNYLPVGQYRSDNLLKLKESLPPTIIKNARTNGLKIITALGFHTHIKWQNSKTDPLLNWRAHKQFLEDMIRLSSEIPDIFIILRYKEIDWISLPIFADLIKEIKSISNITISTDYEKSYVSYDLCAHSDLIIAKHTSLADECLSVGIPVLFHEYTHNTERLVADAFDYAPTRIMCFNYPELMERASVILIGTPNDMTEDYEYLRREIYGGLGDGRTKERIHQHINELLNDNRHCG